MQAINESIRQIKEKSAQDRVESLMSKRVIGATCAATGFEVMKNM
jgi:hypothetical protein